MTQETRREVLLQILRHASNMVTESGKTYNKLRNISVAFSEFDTAWREAIRDEIKGHFPLHGEANELLL